MPLSIQHATPNRRQERHPLSSAFFAIFWALLLVVGVAGTSALKDGVVRAEEPAGPGHSEAPPNTTPIETP